MCGYFKINGFQKGKWLGDQFTDNLKQSITETIKDIEGKSEEHLMKL